MKAICLPTMPADDEPSCGNTVCNYSRAVYLLIGMFGSPEELYNACMRVIITLVALPWASSIA